MGKKDTENAVYVALISGAVGLLWDMLLNPCGKHWIPFFNSPSIDVACFISKGGLRLIPPIPPIGRRGGGGGKGSRYKSRAGELSDLAKSRRDDDGGGGGSGGDGDGGGGGIPFKPSGGGSGSGTKRTYKLTPLSSKEEIEEFKKRRAGIEPTWSLEDIFGKLGREVPKGGSKTPIEEVGAALPTLDDLIAQAGDVFSGGKVEGFGESIFKSINDAFKGLADLFKNPPPTPLEEVLKGEKPLGEIIADAIKGGGRGVRVRYSGLEFYPYEYY